MISRVLILLLFVSDALFGQSNKSNPRYLQSDFGYKETGFSLANWQIIQTGEGLVYAGNTDGLLVYDGISWKRYFDFGILSILQSKSGQIFIGSVGDFGYLSSSKSGHLVFSSLKKQFPDDFEFNSGVWSISENSKGAYFYSKQGVFRWDGSAIKFWNSNEYHNKIVTDDQNAYIINGNSGLVKLTENGEAPISGTEILKSDFLNFLLYTKKGKILGTRHNGIFELRGDSLLSPIQENTSDFIKRNQLFSHRFKSKIKAIGTISGGLRILDNNLNTVSLINTGNGLSNNFIKGIEIDNHQNLWCSLPENISMFEISSPIQLWDKDSGLEGAPYKVGKAFDKLFIGTTKGLFYYKDALFEKVRGINSKIWALSKISLEDNKEALVVSSEQGLILVYDNLSFEIVKNQAETHVYNLKSKPNSIIVSRTTGISLLTITNSKIRQSELIQFSNKDQVVHDVCEDDQGNIWIGAVDEGVYKIESAEAENPQIKLYDKSKGLSAIGEIALAYTASGLFAGNGDGLYVYDSVADTFRKDDRIKGDIKHLSSTNDSTVYAAIKNKEGRTEIQKISFFKGDTISQSTTPFKRIVTTTVTSIFPDKNGVVWFATPDGLYRFDENIKKDYTIPYNTLIRKVVNLDSALFNGTYSEPIPGKLAPKIVVNQPSNYIPTLLFERNSMRFEYASTFYELPERTQYSYFLEGNDKQWSSWSTEHIKEYNNLSAGSYTFKVKAKNIYDHEGNIASYQFIILAPWYQTSWAYVLFTLGGGMLIWFIVLAYSFRVRQHRKKLKLIVADRTFEVISQKKEIEKQNDLLKEQNEKISHQRDAINEKNQKLELSQEEVLNINKKLQELNALLEKKVEQRTSKIKQTLQQLQQTNAELDTFIYRASHDLKGPISRIHGLTSLAKLESTSSNDRKYYDLIELVAKDMNKLLAKLTQVHEVVNAIVDKELIDLPVMISEVRNNINFLDQSGDTKYSFDLKSTLQVKSDPFLLTIVLTNLMENALIFRKNSINDHQITVKADEDKESYYIEVVDNGLGIAESHLNKVFNMFFRGSDQSKGSGLGLYLVKVAIEKLHGEISVTSEPNDKTTFFVKFPK
jgi:signal transduction histidine kinase/ligand-binding sensor domain-containing protein